jgi:hypothetical protein
MMGVEPRALATIASTAAPADPTAEAYVGGFAGRCHSLWGKMMCAGAGVAVHCDDT